MLRRAARSVTSDAKPASREPETSQEQIDIRNSRRSILTLVQRATSDWWGLRELRALDAMFQPQTDSGGPRWRLNPFPDTNLTGAMTDIGDDPTRGRS